MDFFAAQAQSRRRSRWLMLWFVLAVMCIIGLCYVLALFLGDKKQYDFRAFLQVAVWCSYALIAFVLYYAWLRKIGTVFFTMALAGLSFAIFFAHDIHRRVAAMLPATDEPVNFLSLWNGELFFWTFLIVGGSIAIASLYKMDQISRHGPTLIAKQLGGRMIMWETRDPAEKRLLNVIDEMAIAAGIPAPLAFVLDQETSLNAFAAGLGTQDCVIGVTRGLLDAMNRDELQGVIGHEISHIVNGDSRLNLRLIGLLFGIYFLTQAGLRIMEGSGRAGGKGSGGGILIGLVLWVIGLAGLFFGRLIQAAISREREYLADASAVQFTRHPIGLSSALRKLKTSGSKIEHPEAGAASHLFFGNSGAALFNTHPPLAERIRRLSGIHMDQMDAAETSSSLPVAALEGNNPPPVLAANPNAAMPAFLPAAILMGGLLPEEISPESLDQAQTLLAGLPESLREHAHYITGATGILGGLLLSKQPDTRAKQEKLLPPDALPAAQELYQWLCSQPEHGARYRLVWLDLILPVLRQAPETGRQQFLAMSKELIRATGRMSPSAFALHNILSGALLPPSERQVKQSELHPERLDQNIVSLLALITYAGHEDEETAQAAYQAAIACSPAQTQHPFPAKTELSFKKVSEALSHLALAAPPYRKKLLHACEVAIRYDGKITSVESELLRAFAQGLGCPAPLTEA
ncbi:MAG: M48 family metallopeptidase [Zoogloeaceae bacterium]|jgi:Zn-dependent protease with chaperone function|nr:M48 family metallopeptidase [Zoogloeaceae bacterium]